MTASLFRCDSSEALVDRSRRLAINQYRSSEALPILFAYVRRPTRSGREIKLLDIVLAALFAVHRLGIHSDQRPEPIGAWRAVNRQTTAPVTIDRRRRRPDLRKKARRRADELLRHTPVATFADRRRRHRRAPRGYFLALPNALVGATVPSSCPPPVQFVVCTAHC